MSWLNKRSKDEHLARMADVALRVPTVPPLPTPVPAAPTPLIFIEPDPTPRELFLPHLDVESPPSRNGAPASPTVPPPPSPTLVVEPVMVADPGWLTGTVHPRGSNGDRDHEGDEGPPPQQPQPALGQGAMDPPLPPSPVSPIAAASLGATPTPVAPRIWHEDHERPAQPPGIGGRARRRKPPRHLRKKVQVAELLAVRAELLEVRARLDATERAKARVDDQLHALGATTAELRRASLVGPTPTPTPTDDGRLDQLRGTVEALRQHLDARPSQPPIPTDDGRLDRLSGTVEELRQRLDQQIAAATTEPGPQVEVSGQLSQLAERIAATDDASRTATERLDVLDQRLGNVSTELANQLRELGRDIDQLVERSRSNGDTAAITDELLDALRDGQTKLVAEQARYEIAFRHDLADLAEQVRRASPR